MNSNDNDNTNNNSNINSSKNNNNEVKNTNIRILLVSIDTESEQNLFHCHDNIFDEGYGSESKYDKIVKIATYSEDKVLKQGSEEGTQQQIIWYNN